MTDAGLRGLFTLAGEYFGVAGVPIRRHLRGGTWRRGRRKSGGLLSQAPHCLEHPAACASEISNDDRLIDDMRASNINAGYENANTPADVDLQKSAELPSSARINRC